jgi:transcriptional regulator with XRE-family HTH domain
MSVHGARFGRDCAMTSRVPSASPAASNRRKGSIDVHVGERIRQRRAVLDLSLDVVASRIGVSPQQLQKYEAADNRITAGRLFTCANALDVPVSFFFDGLTDGRDDSAADPRVSSSARAGQVSVDEVGELLRLYSSIVDHDIRRRAIEYIRSLVPAVKKNLQA